MVNTFVRLKTDYSELVTICSGWFLKIYRHPLVTTWLHTIQILQLIRYKIETIKKRKEKTALNRKEA